MPTIICSHGFGVRADARGMFTEFASSFPEYNFALFDFNTFDNQGNIIVASIDDQAEKLQEIINQNEEGSILLCHSQGSIIAGLVDLSRISRVILLAPPIDMSMERIVEKMMNKPGSEVNLTGISKLPRRDGSVTLLPHGYLESMRGRNPLRLYASIASSKPTAIIRALHDEVLGLTNLEEVKNAQVYDLEADHNFTGISRKELISRLKTILS